MSSVKRMQDFLVAPYTEQSGSLGKSIAKALEERVIELALIDEYVPAGAMWIENIQRAIERADFIVADVTDQNPNVMYEVGFAYALRKPVLPIVKRGVGEVPHVIAGYIYLVYDPSKLDELSKEIEVWAQRNQPKWKQEEAQR